jgi:hypothetical protein
MLAVGCDHTPLLLVSIDADASAEQVDLFVRDDQTHELLFHSGFVPAATADGASIDLAKDPLRIGVRLDEGGHYTLLAVGAIGPLLAGKPSPDGIQLFWAGHVKVDGTSRVDAHLITVPPGDDQDRDLWPDGADFLAHQPEALARYGDKPDLLDCDDKSDFPPRADGTALTLKAEQINPFSTEVCSDGYDENCNGDADEPCIDADGDGDTASTDCDDADPKRHRATAADPFPDPPNCCGYNLGKEGDEAKKDFSGDPALCPMVRCGDGIDEACQGKDTTCVLDADCDGSPPPPFGEDCDDTNPAIHPGAIEICNNGVNESCNLAGADIGCVPCDLDGDGYQRDDPASGCPDNTNAHPGIPDCNDYDAGVHPGATTAAGGKEGGINAQGKVATALKGLCRHIYQPTGVTGTGKIGPAGFMIGDADCNGTPYEACPPASCDADGDGWPVDGCGALALPGPFDCNDNDPTIFPGAPDVCGDTIDGSCAGADTPCSGLDKDGDGYLPPADCDDNNKDVHPFATETCNQNDDDCDGDLDEGNPDPSGAPRVVSGALTSCTDSNVGECGKTPGYCVCSAAKSGGAVNVSSHYICPGEDAAALRAPRCFGAGQPHAQSCDDALDKDDDCDGRFDAPDGKNLVIKGMPCGLSVGACKPGVAVACMEKPTKEWYGTAPPAGKLHWECSTDTIPSVPEVCNGIDDDCDGALPSAEQDGDSDKYLACMMCVQPIAAGLSGCNDCLPGDNASHPGAVEACDGADNNCDGNVDETPNACTAMGKSCCFAQGGACADLMTDARFCGSCTNSCLNSGQGNQCKNGACVCKTGGVACASGNWCNPNTNGGTCETCNTDQHCGASCGSCTGSTMCSGGMLSGGSCTGSSCGGTSECLGHFGCASTTTCRLNCTKDSECETGYWCKAGVAGLNTCQVQQPKNTACSDSNCATSGCKQCDKSGGTVCPGGANPKCPA